MLLCNIIHFFILKSLMCYYVDVYANSIAVRIPFKLQNLKGKCLIRQWSKGPTYTVQL